MSDQMIFKRYEIKYLLTHSLSPRILLSYEREAYYAKGDRRGGGFGGDTGGEIYVDGPTNSGNGSLDYAGSGTITGGTFVATGASGMAMNFGTDSTQGSMLVSVSNSYVTGPLTLTDSDGNVLVSYEPDKEYNSVLISCARLAEGETYTLTTGDTTTTVEMTSLIYGADNMGGQKGLGFQDKPENNDTGNSTL